MFKIYFTLQTQYLKTEMGYTANFWMMMFSGVITRVALIAIPFVIFQNVPDVVGWSQAEVYFIIAFAFLSEGVCNIWFNGIWGLPSLVFNGKLDTFLCRPCSPLLQVLSSGMGLQGISILVMGVSTLVLSLINLEMLNFGVILLCLLFIICGTAIRLSVYIITICLIFFFDFGGRNDVPYIAGGIGDYANYPVSIYPSWMQFILLFIIPFGFIGYVPALILRGENAVVLTSVLILVTILLSVLAVLFFNKGIQKYESMGM